MRSEQRTAGQRGFRISPEQLAENREIWRRYVRPGSDLIEILKAAREINARFPEPGVQRALDAARTGSLGEILDVVREMNGALPVEEVARGLDAARAQLVASNLAQRALHTGDLAPDFTLSDHVGRTVRLNEALKGGPVVLSFYRGSWCPYCNIELRALQEHLDEIEREGGSLMAISPEPPDKAMIAIEKHELRFPVLYDKENAVANQYRLVMEIPDAIREHQIRDLGFDVAQHNATGHYRVPVPATYVINTDGNITLDYVNADYRYRIDPLDILAHLREKKSGATTAKDRRQ